MASALSTLVLAGVLSAFLLIVRTGTRAAGYSTMEAELRGGLEAFARDARAAVDVRWGGPQRLTLVLPDAAAPAVTYAYDADPASPTHRSLYREVAGAAGGPARQVLVRGLAGDFAFRRYRLGGVGGAEPAPAANDLETKQLQLVLRAQDRTDGRGPAATQSALSARFVLRNKRVTN